MGGCHISMVDRAGCAVAVTGLVLLSFAKAHSAALTVTVTGSIRISPCIRATGPASLRGLNRRSHIDPGARSRSAEGNRNVRQNRDERRSRAGTRKRLFENAVVIRDQRDYHVGRVSAPMSFERPNLLVVEHPDDHMHQRDQLGRAQRPTPPQHDVVDFLKLNARQFRITSIEFKRSWILLSRTSYGRCCSQMTASRALAAARWPPPESM
jgi:hypothetical protein